ncbi:hypothetical protein FNV43_RR10570 [Rhamnella rubrinervis]|uniref:NAC domain-containing protein n=1 Tax=Rhamnella rubrinervis TaxID=2594499 RepID=A0A8K0H4F7_9ROSA|nr:hypothetical protein FNV43_RR10570 [Rhamnella rubrinervis]
MEMESCVPPGFRFHPTEEELVSYYLKRKILSLKIDLDVIIDIDLYKMEPWDIQARCNLGYYEQNEWYFFSHKDKKYPTGTRTNRATAAGFWKATGRDKAVVQKNSIIGMRKTLVFYKGRAPNGRKTDWIMHEYRLQTSDIAPPQEEGWVVCRAFKKPTPNHRQGYEAWNHHAYYVSRDQNGQIFKLPAAASAMDLVMSSSDQKHMVMINPNNINELASSSTATSFDHSVQELVSNHVFSDHIQLINELPKLDSPSNISTNLASSESNFGHNNCILIGEQDQYREVDESNNNNNNISSHDIDWKNLDSLLASQLTHDSTSFAHYSSNCNDNKDNGQNHHLLGCFPDL